MHAVVCPAGEDTREHPIQLAKSIFLDSAALRKTSGRELENTYSSAIALQVDSINFIQTISATNLSAPGEDARRRHIANLFALDGKMVHILAIEALLAKIYRKGIAA
jgi:chemotaxis signal transduction protein